MLRETIFDVYGLSDAGVYKSINEDSFVYKVANVAGNTAGVFAVADGVGGLAHGEWASRLCIGKLNAWWESELLRYSVGENTINVDGLISVIRETNSQIINEAKQRSERSGTTLTLVCSLNNLAVMAHVGDSRCYKIKKGIFSHIEQLTSDHSCEMEVLRNGTKRRKSVLTDCVGYKEDFRLDIRNIEFKNGDHYILCSDGIYKTQNNRTIEVILKKRNKDLKSICEALVNGAKVNGEQDNISVIVFGVKIKGSVV